VLARSRPCGAATEGSGGTAAGDFRGAAARPGPLRPDRARGSRVGAVDAVVDHRDRGFDGDLARIARGAPVVHDVLGDLPDRRLIAGDRLAAALVLVLVHLVLLVRVGV